MKKTLLLLLALSMLFVLVACKSEQLQDNATCWSCGGTIAAPAAFCEHCGVSLKETSPETNNGTTEATQTPTNESTACVHTWQDATCTVPKTCSKCGATEGQTAAHQWIDATCSAPKTCSVCGQTTGNIGQHTYNDQGKCVNCQALDPVLVSKYDQAVDIVVRCTSSSTQSGADLAKAYKLFAELGNFKNAQEYLSRFSRTSVLTKTNQTAVNAFGEPSSTFVPDNTRRTYNAQGQLIELYDGFFTILYTYTENGKLDTEAYKIGTAQSSTSFIVQHIYDANGIETHVKRTLSNGNAETKALTYDAQGRLTRTYEFTGSLIGAFRYVKYQYDESGRVISMSKEIGNELYRYTYSGDQITECKITSPNSSSYDLVMYFYEGNRLIKTESTYYNSTGAKGTVTTTLYTYSDYYIYHPSK